MSPKHASDPSNAKNGFQRQRAALKHCAALLAEIRSQRETLATFPQRNLDSFLSSSPTQRDALAPFTRWLRRQRLSTLHVDFRKHHLEGSDFDSNHRREMAQMFLTAPDIEPKTRTAALLVLLYGIQLTRIVAIRRTQVDITSRPIKLTVGNDAIELPNILGDAILYLTKEASNSPEGWLFPGRNPGLHLKAGSLSNRLRTWGVRSRSARTTALIELTQQMHPRITSDLLGITPTVAASWSRLSGGDWSDYPSTRHVPQQEELSPGVVLRRQEERP